MTKERVLGCDISSYQGDVDFNKMKSAGAEYVILRKHVGYRPDARFFEYLDMARLVGLAVGSYGVPFPGWDIQRQILAFADGIEPEDLDFPPFPDVEKKHQLTLQKAISDILAYTYGLVNWWGEAAFYTAKYVWQDYYSKAYGWIDDWKLWDADYTAPSPDNPDDFPLGWEKTSEGIVVPVEQRYVIWQFSADKNGRGKEFGVSSDSIDLDWMDKDYFEKYVKEPASINDLRPENSHGGPQEE